MIVKKIFAVMLTAAVAGSVMVACNSKNEDSKDTSIAGTYKGNVAVSVNNTPIPVEWTVKNLTNDTISITTDTMQNLGVSLSIKAFGKKEAADSTLYGNIVPLENFELPNIGAITLSSGTVSYNHAAKTSLVSIAGTIYTATDLTTTPPTMGTVPLSVTLTGTKK
jgi:hypothetical protein